MRIAQVAPLHESVPPKRYGGTERIVSYLTEELVRAGHEVTLFGSGDSVTGARLIAPCRQALRKNERCKDSVAREVVVEHAREFDLIHFHMSYLHFAITCHLDVTPRCDERLCLSHHTRSEKFSNQRRAMSCFGAFFFKVGLQYALDAKIQNQTRNRKGKYEARYVKNIVHE